MYQQSFGRNGQVQFANEHEFYKFGSTVISVN